jgi:hypothetical protein
MGTPFSSSTPFRKERVDNGSDARPDEGAFIQDGSSLTVGTDAVVVRTTDFGQPNWYCAWAASEDDRAISPAAK